MRKRVVFGLAGGFLGMAVAPLVNGSLELPEGVVFSGLGVVGLVIGYVASIFVDVFTGNQMEEADTPSE